MWRFPNRDRYRNTLEQMNKLLCCQHFWLHFSGQMAVLIQKVIGLLAFAFQYLDFIQSRKPFSSPAVAIFCSHWAIPLLGVFSWWTAFSVRLLVCHFFFVILPKKSWVCLQSWDIALFPWVAMILSLPCMSVIYLKLILCKVKWANILFSQKCFLFLQWMTLTPLLN